MKEEKDFNGDKMAVDFVKFVIQDLQRTIIKRGITKIENKTENTSESDINSNKDFLQVYNGSTWEKVDETNENCQHIIQMLQKLNNCLIGIEDVKSVIKDLECQN